MHHERRFADVQIQDSKKNKTRIFAVLILTCLIGLNSFNVVLVDVETQLWFKDKTRCFVWKESLLYKNFNPECVATMSPPGWESSQQLEHNRCADSESALQSWFQSWGKLWESNRMPVNNLDWFNWTSWLFWGYILQCHSYIAVFLKIRSIRVLDSIVCLMQFVWLFSQAWDAVQLACQMAVSIWHLVTDEQHWSCSRTNVWHLSTYPIHITSCLLPNGC